jgi:hypothetical protein
MADKVNVNSVLDPLPANILFDIARNESASEEWRKAAVKLLRKKGYKQAQHPELAFIVRELEKEELAEKEVIAVVESAVEEEFHEGHEVDHGGEA